MMSKRQKIGDNKLWTWKRTIRSLSQLIALLLLLCSCEFKPLYVDTIDTRIEVSIYDINLELLWGFNWETEWKYYTYWDTIQYGPIGYTMPEEQVCAQFYPLDGNMSPTSCWQKHFEVEGGAVEIIPGYYNMLFYNDVELKNEHSITFSDMRDLTSFVATSSPNRDAINTRSAETLNEPDQLFGVHMPQSYVSDDPDDYEYINGNYVFHIKTVLEPYVYIYLFQVLLYNNEDNKVVGAEAIDVSGMSKGVEMLARRNLNDTISISIDCKPLHHHPEGFDIMGARMQSFGLSSIDPLYTRDATRMDVPNQATVTLRLRNGKLYPVTFNITGQMQEKLTGGVITLEYDTNNIPEKELESDQGGGFDVRVDDWTGVDSVEVRI